MKEPTPMNVYHRAALVKRLVDIVKIAETEVKTLLLDEMATGDRKYVEIDGERVATISRSAAKYQEFPVIRSERELIAWMKSNGHEESVQVRETIPDWWIKNNLTEIIKAGEVPDGVIIDAKESGGYITVRQTQDQAEAIDGILAAGRLTAILDSIQQIER